MSETFNAIDDIWCSSPYFLCKHTHTHTHTHTPPHAYKSPSIRRYSPATRGRVNHDNELKYEAAHLLFQGIFHPDIPAERSPVPHSVMAEVDNMAERSTSSKSLHLSYNNRESRVSLCRANKLLLLLIFRGAVMKMMNGVYGTFIMRKTHQAG